MQTRGVMFRFRGILFVLSGIGLLWMLSSIMSTFSGINVTMVDVLPGRVDTSVVSTIDRKIDTTTYKQTMYGVIVSSATHKHTNRAYEWKDTNNDDELKGMFELLENELGEYSSEYLRKIGLHKILIVDDIQTKDGQPVLGFSDPLAGEIYLNSLATSGRQSRAVIGEQTVHHEIGHFLAYSEYGYLFDQRSGWSSLSKEDLYGKISSVDSEYFPADGYVSRYALTSASEDFAETYSLIFTDQFQDRLSEEAAKSGLLRSKLEITYQMMNQVDSDQCLTSYQALDEACH